MHSYISFPIERSVRLYELNIMLKLESIKVFTITIVRHTMFILLSIWHYPIKNYIIDWSKPTVVAPLCLLEQVFLL